MKVSVGLINGTRGVTDLGKTWSDSVQPSPASILSEVVMASTEMPDKPFRISDHARQRLKERSTLTEEKLLSLLEANAFKKIHTQWKMDASQRDVDEIATEHGLTFSEMKKFGLVNVKALYEHMLVWSSADQRAYTIVAAIEGDFKRVVTVLYSDFFSSHDWSDKVTEKSVGTARRKAEELENGTTPTALPKEKLSVSQITAPIRYEGVVYWLDGENSVSKMRIFKLPESTSQEQLREESTRIAKGFADRGRGINVIVRNRKNKDEILLDFSLD